MSRKSETRTYGATSNTITLKMDPQAKMGGGTMSALVTNQYERNFLLEAALNDLIIEMSYVHIMALTCWL